MYKARRAFFRVVFSSGFLFLFLNIGIINVFSQEVLKDFSGQVLNENLGVELATVVIKELDQVELSDGQGTFVFYGVPVGTYTLLIVADGFDEQEFSIVIDATTVATVQRQFQLTRIAEEVYQTEEIVVLAERFKNSNTGKRVYSKEEVDALPLRGEDPISIVLNETGVVSIGNNERGNFTLTNTKGRLYSFGAEYSLYGGDTAWNKYFYGNIQIPTNVHASNPQAAVVTRSAVDSITSFKGTPDGMYGQGLASTVVLTPRRDDNNYLHMDISPTDPSLGFNYWISEHINLFISGRYSISQWTVIPIANLLLDSIDNIDGELTNFQYSDALVSMTYANNGHEVNLLGLGFQDKSVLKIEVDPPEDGGGDEDAVGFVGDLTTTPLYGAMGISWAALVGDMGVNSFYTYVSVYNSTNDILVDVKGEFLSYVYGYKGFVNTLDYRIHDYYEHFLTENTSLRVGAEFQFLDLAGKHEDIFRYNDSGITTGNNIDDQEPTFYIKENVYRLYGYTEYRAKWNNNNTTLTLGASEILNTDEHPLDVFFPSARVANDTLFGNDWKLSFSSAISPTFMEGSKFADRRISEVINDYDNATKFTVPTYGITSVPKLTYQINDANAVFLEPFFGYYYNFSGFNPNITVDNVEGTTRGYLYLTPERGISTGGAVEWAWDRKNHLASASYTLGFAWLDTKEYGWLRPENDYRHQLKYTYVYRRFKAGTLGISGSVLFDHPFTPTKIIERNETTNSWVEEPGAPYSESSYLPIYELYLNVRGTIIDRKKIKLTYRVQPGNILGVFYYQDNGILNKEIGASNADIDNRNITFRLAPESLFQNIYAGIFIEFALPNKRKK